MTGKVLIIDDLATNRIILKVKLSAAYYDVVQAETVEDASELLEPEAPDLILLSARMTRNTTLPRALQQLRGAGGAVDVPIVIMLDDNSPDTRLDALKAGADEVLPGMMDEQLFLARLRSLMRQRLADQELRHHARTARALGFAEQAPQFTDQGQVVIVAGDRHGAAKLQSRLAGRSHHALRLTSAEEAMGAPWRSASRNAGPPDVFMVLVAPTDEQQSLRLVAELRAAPGTRHCPVIAVVPRTASAMIAALLDLGAGDVVFTDTSPDEISLRLDTQLRRRRMADQMRSQLQDSLQAAALDPLTGLYNRRYALSYLNCLIDGARQDPNVRFAVMIADLDYFKQVNDTYGHAAGDAVLIDVAQTLRVNLRKDDLVARIGGEEFLIILSDSSCSQARCAANTLCRIVRDTPVKLPASPDAAPGGTASTAHVTISIGLTHSDVLKQAPGAGASELLEQADRALYRSKAEGRNTVTLSSLSAA